MTTRWLFADQLGPHFSATDADHSVERIVIIESRRVFRRMAYHRAKAHVVLSAIRHRAAEQPDRVTVIHAETYADGWAQVPPEWRTHVDVIDPTSHAARRLVRSGVGGVRPFIHPSRGFVTSETDFQAWADRRTRKRLLMEDFYRDARVRTGLLMDGGEPVGGQWNFDEQNRERPPRGQTSLGGPEPWWPAENDIDARVREDLDRWQRDDGIEFLGSDGPRRFAVTHEEAKAALAHFVEFRLSQFGPYEDAVMAGDWTMSHSLLSVPLNLGLLDPRDVAQAAEDAYRRGDAPLNSVEGFIRQVIGWRDYVWHLYWHLGEDYLASNALEAQADLPDWWRNLETSQISAACVRWSLDQVRDHGWTHHIPRLMILGNYALQRGLNPEQTLRWFQAAFVDGYEWVMAANVIGMALHADGGVMATKPYAAGGAYLHRMTDLCRSCVYRPDVRIGEQACPMTAGYWSFLSRTRQHWVTNHRMGQMVRGLDRLSDRDAVVAQERERGTRAP